MTQEEAEKRAQELWGNKAFAILVGLDRYVVGECNGPFKRPYGFGTSWDEAFKNAHFNLN